MATISQDRQLISNFLQHCHRKTYKAKQLIIKAGDPSEELFYIVSGSVTVILENSSGHEMVLTYLNAGDFFGEIGLFEDGNRTAFVRAKSKCDIAKISYKKMKNMHNLFPHLLRSIAAQMAIRLKKTSYKACDLAFTDVTGRIVRILLDLCKEPDAMTHPHGMQIRTTRQELSKIAGCSREVVGKVLKKLEEDNLISVSGKTIVIFDNDSSNKLDHLF